MSQDLARERAFTRGGFRPLNLAVFERMQEEFERAFSKHAGMTPRSTLVGDLDSIVILVEEVGEVARALTYDEGNGERLAEELIQVATMAAAWAERLLIRGD